MGILESFGFLGSSQQNIPSQELPEIFPLDLSKTDFVRNDLVAIYTKILTDVAERTQGIGKVQKTLWDSFLMSDSNKGLITRLAEAMADKKDLFLVYDKTFEILRDPTQDEKKQIEEDYRKMAYSEIGVYISFRNFKRTDMIKIYSSLEYFVIGSFNKGVNTSNALQVKMADMRKSTGLRDSDVVIEQAKAIAAGLNQGRSVLLDAGDSIETATPQIEPTNRALDFINQKRSFYLGLPAAYITGIQTGGLSSSGEGDSKAIERGLKNYFHSVFAPICNALYDIEVSYKTQDFRQVSQGFEALKTFLLVEDQSILSTEEQRKIVRSLFDMDVEAD